MRQRPDIYGVVVIASLITILATIVLFVVLLCTGNISFPGT